MLFFIVIVFIFERNVVNWFLSRELKRSMRGEEDFDVNVMKLF